MRFWLGLFYFVSLSVWAGPTVTNKAGERPSLRIQQIHGALQSLGAKYDAVVSEVELGKASMILRFNDGSLPIEITLDDVETSQSHIGTLTFEIVMPRKDVGDLRAQLKRALIGHAFHPYISKPGHPFIPRESQTAASRALQASNARGSRSFLEVSPARTGKTDLINTFYELHLSQGGTHLVIVDNVELLEQHEQTISALYASKADIVVFAGDQNEFKRAAPTTRVTSFDASLIENSERPRIILTTIHQFRNQIENLLSDGDLLEKIAIAIKSVTYDEGHHLGASEAFQVVNMILTHAKSTARLLYLTATPIHATADIPALFRPLGSDVHYAYVDLDQKQFDYALAHRFDGSVLLYQLSEAFRLGDLTNFGDIDFLTNENLGLEPDEQLYAKEKHFWTIDPEKYGKLFSFLEPSLRNHNKGLIVARSIDEANRLAKFLRKNMKDKKFFAYHTDVADARRSKIRENFIAGKIQYLIVVRTFQEGITIPGIDLYVDVTSSSSLGSFVQKIGRVTGLEEGKMQADAILGFHFDEGSLQKDAAVAFDDFLHNPAIYRDGPEDVVETESSLDAPRPVRHSQYRRPQLSKRGALFSGDSAAELNETDGASEEDIRDALYPDHDPAKESASESLWAERRELVERVIPLFTSKRNFDVVRAVFAGQSVEEIAAARGVSTASVYSTIKAIVFDIREKLRHLKFIETHGQYDVAARAARLQRDELDLLRAALERVDLHTGITDLEMRVLRLRLVDGMQNADIATEANIPLHRVPDRYADGKSKLWANAAASSHACFADLRAAANEAAAVGRVHTSGPWTWTTH